MTGRDRSITDYVVVGAGSAGSVIVRRLLDAGHSVHVIEAGGPDTDPALHSPAAWVSLLQGGSHDWGWSTAPQRGANGRSIAWPRGRVLGGSSSVNAMIYIRGHASDYDGWAESTGDPDWAWRNVLPLFKRSEANDLGSDRFHGADGPLPVSSIRTPHPLSTAFIESAKARGHTLIDDFNAQQMTGVGYVQTTTRAGRRMSAWQSYVAPHVDNPNLTITTGALVHRILFAKNRAIGVAFSRDGGAVRGYAYADAEVVLSGGVLGSAQTLLLSGIGPASHLQSVGVETVVDLPGVGANLHDHPLGFVLYEAAAKLPEPSNNLTEAQLFARSTNCPDGAPPDLQPVFLHVSLPVAGYPVPEHGYGMGAGLVAPRSRGTLRLASPNPAQLPIADPNILADPYDLEALVDAIEMCREIGASESFAPWRNAEFAPGSACKSRDELRKYVRMTVSSYFHPVGTCKMGAADDPDAVVGSDLRVRGVQGLRVADASIMPTITHGNTNAPTIMIGERASDLILRRCAS